MGVVLINTPQYICRCDNCKKSAIVDKTVNIYNGAQAVRSLSWSFSKNGKVLCKNCRMSEPNDHYKWFK